MRSNQASRDALFIFAHQDDEMAVFAHIDRIVASGGRVVCAFLTFGQTADDPIAPKRNAESLKNLTALGVEAKDIHFIGETQGFLDGQLVDKIPDAVTGLADVTKTYPQFETVYTHAWEGGHPDHDAAFIITHRWADAQCPGSIILSFGLYRATKTVLPYVVGIPMKGAPAQNESVGFRAALRYAGMLTRYRTQAKAMIGLAPFLLVNWFLCRREWVMLQSASVATARPHVGPLLYESFNRMTYEEFKRRTAV